MSSFGMFDQNLNPHGFILQQGNAHMHKPHIVENYSRRLGWNVLERFP